MSHKSKLKRQKPSDLVLEEFLSKTSKDSSFSIDFFLTVIFVGFLSSITLIVLHIILITQKSSQPLHHFVSG